jgi:hypothetical protein
MLPMRRGVNRVSRYYWRHEGVVVKIAADEFKELVDREVIQRPGFLLPFQADALRRKNLIIGEGKGYYTVADSDLMEDFDCSC